jgi:predicted membrane protein
MSPILIEAIGIIATLLILFSMLFRTTTLKGDIRMRALNLVGSIVFTIYGILIPAYSTAILNGALIIINTYHLIMLVKESKKQNPQEEQK